MTGVLVLSDCPVIMIALDPPSFEITSGKRLIVPEYLISILPMFFSVTAHLCHKS